MNFRELTSDDADVRREAVMALSSGKTAQLKSTPELLGVVALDDKDALVKATAVEALAQYSQWPRLTDVLAQTATDENAMVRLATVQVLDANKRSESLIILLDMLEAETDNETRSEIADALGYYPDRRVLRGLIETVAHDDFRVSYSSRQSLVTLTGQDHQYDDDAWRKWLAETTQPFSGIPDKIMFLGIKNFDPPFRRRA